MQCVQLYAVTWMICNDGGDVDQRGDVCDGGGEDDVGDRGDGGDRG